MTVAKWMGIGLLGGALLILCLFGFAKWVGFSTSDFLALLQLVVDLSMVPITVIGFVILIGEFRKSQAAPKLDLTFGNAAKEIPLDNSTTITFYMHNTGNAIATWYSVDIQIPDSFSVYNFTPLPPAKDEHWFVVKEESGQIGIFAFSSGGQVPVYPNRSTPILAFGLMLAFRKQNAIGEPQREERYTMIYTITSEREEPVQGKLFLQQRAIDPEQVRRAMEKTK
jgi:hypothetical protein